MECPLHQNETQVVDGVLRDICDILKYSFVLNANRTISYFGRKIDLDYQISHDEKKCDTLLRYSVLLRDRSIGCECSLKNVLDNLGYEKEFVSEYTVLIKNIVKDIGEKAVCCCKGGPVILRFADLKRHYNK